MPTTDRVTAAPLSVLILHGWQNHRPAGHWQHILADDLWSAGVDVRYPQLPDPDDPDSAVWSAQVAAEIDSMTADRRIVVAHSLTSWVMLRLLAMPNPPRLDRILLVAPVSRAVLAENRPISAFDPPLGDEAITAAVTGHGAVHVVCSDDDQYFTGGAAGWAKRLGATVHPLTGQGHLALGDGYGRWDSVRDWLLCSGDGADCGVIQPR